MMSFSLLTGERLNVVRYSKGGGPNELPQNKAGFALAPGGHLFVADPSKVLELDPLGEVVSYWLPRAPMRLGICSFGGEPAVPTVGGVVRRSAGGPDRGYRIKRSDGRERHSGQPRTRAGHSRQRLGVPGWSAMRRRHSSWSLLRMRPTRCTCTTWTAGRTADLSAPPRVDKEVVGSVVGLTILGVRIIRGGRCPDWNERLRPSMDEQREPRTGQHDRVRTVADRCHHRSGERMPCYSSSPLAAGVETWWQPTPTVPSSFTGKSLAQRRWWRARGFARRPRDPQSIPQGQRRTVRRHAAVRHWPRLIPRMTGHSWGSFARIRSGMCLLR